MNRLLWSSRNKKIQISVVHFPWNKKPHLHLIICSCLFHRAWVYSRNSYFDSSSLKPSAVGSGQWNHFICIHPSSHYWVITWSFDCMKKHCRDENVCIVETISHNKHCISEAVSLPCMMAMLPQTIYLLSAMHLNAFTIHFLGLKQLLDSK